MTAGGYVILAYVVGLLLLWGYAARLLIAARKQQRGGSKSCPSS